MFVCILIETYEILYMFLTPIEYELASRVLHVWWQHIPMTFHICGWGMWACSIWQGPYNMLTPLTPDIMCVTLGVCTVGLLLLLCLLWTLLCLFLTATVVSTIQRVWCTAIPARSGSVMGVAIHPAGASSACLYLIACRNQKVKLLITWNDNNEIFTHFCQHQPYFDRQVMWHVCNERSVRSRWQLLYLHWLNGGLVQVYLL